MWTEIILKTRWRHDNHVISLTEVFFKTKIQIDRWFLCFEIPLLKCGRKTLMSFHTEISIFKFLRRSVDEKHLTSENIWWVFKVKSPFSTFLRRSVDENIWCRKTFDELSHWNLHFQIPQAQCGRKTFDVGKHLTSFQSETSVFKFLWRSLDGASREYLPCSRLSVSGTIEKAGAGRAGSGENDSLGTG